MKMMKENGKRGLGDGLQGEMGYLEMQWMLDCKPRKALWQSG